MRSRFHRGFECSFQHSWKEFIASYWGSVSRDGAKKIPRRTEERLEVKLALPKADVGDTVVSL